MLIGRSWAYHFWCSPFYRGSQEMQEGAQDREDQGFAPRLRTPPTESLPQLCPLQFMVWEAFNRVGAGGESGGILLLSCLAVEV